jgi:CubicO group peptidase (beta-lactamase class C family)
MLSTVKDYWRFSQMILNGGVFEGKRYLEARTVDLMHTNAIEPGVELMVHHDTKGLGFGFGFGIVQDPAAAKTSQGLQSYFWSGGYGTWIWIDPVNDMIVIGFINNANSANSSRLAAMLLMGRHLGKLAYKALNESSRNEAENID